MSIIEIAIIAVIAAAVFFALRRIAKMRKSGCCCATCSGECQMSCKKEARPKP